MKKLGKIFFLAVMGLIFNTAYANDGQLVFYCKTNTGKQIFLTKSDNYYTYSFGRNLKSPEIILRKALNEVEVEEHSAYGGVGGTWYTLKNGTYTYDISFGTSDDGRDFAGVSVYNKGNEIADVKCNLNTLKLGY
ncbi:hypothetical protein L4G92_01465 [Neisseria sp. ZJ106]|uniref:Uncharacterized protein n=1 Tax=Neisseria lisongii TaxID=2912188 RepID=A0AAW5AK87_9NEIS|nr:hypothetical protein [Neisseria lisongii]MCF7520722.1 hypothetical protein [Neisseria lisongii]MCF7528875.1 hypothetical protein [Neisseria lisongii]WCL72368.1 hypothetical protein PJU73_04535 [Neisseria lisongii]